MIQAPNDERPIRSMPQTTDEETEPQVEILAGFSLHAATTQGKVQVILNEHAESLVPTPPKF